MPVKNHHSNSKSLRKGLKVALLDLFDELNIKSIEIETRLTLTVSNFTDDFIKVYDEITGPSDIQALWHVPQELAHDLYAVCSEFLTSKITEKANDSDDDGEENWDSDESESSTNTTSSDSDTLSSDSESSDSETIPSDSEDEMMEV